MPVNGFDPVVPNSNRSSILSMAERSPCDSPSPTNSVGQSNGRPEHMDCGSLSSKHSAEQMSSDDMDDLTPQPAVSPRLHQPSDNEMEMCLNMFEHWPQLKQTQFVEKLVSRMSFHQHEHIYSILMPMLQRDFITVLPSEHLFFGIGHAFCAREAFGKEQFAEFLSQEEE